MSDIGLEKRCDGLRQYESIGRLSSEKLNGMEKKKKKKLGLPALRYLVYVKGVPALCSNRPK